MCGKTLGGTNISKYVLFYCSNVFSLRSSRQQVPPRACTLSDTFVPVFVAVSWHAACIMKAQEYHFFFSSLLFTNQPLARLKQQTVLLYTACKGSAASFPPPRGVVRWTSRLHSFSILVLVFWRATCGFGCNIVRHGQRSGTGGWDSLFCLPCCIRSTTVILVRSRDLRLEKQRINARPKALLLCFKFFSPCGSLVWPAACKLSDRFFFVFSRLWRAAWKRYER